MTTPRVLSARQLNRATLGRQLLLRREPLSVEAAVRRVAGLQAQEPASPYLALWNRVSDFDPADLDADFAAHSVVKSSLMRITLHAVHADDYPPFHAAMLSSLRASCLGDPRFTGSGLTHTDADALWPHLTEFAAQPRGRAELEALLEERLGFRHAGVWWALRRFAPLWHAPGSHAWSFGPRPAYVAARVPEPWSVEAAVQHLVGRTLDAFGPASVQDISQFTLLRRPVVRAALESLDVVRSLGPGGTELFDRPGLELPDEDTPAPPRLMAMWDSVLLAYADRRRVLPEPYRRRVIQSNGDVLPTLLVDGYVAGVWRPVEGGIEATAFHPLTDDVWDGLAAEARALIAFLAGRDPVVYRRYAHWWGKLPPGEVRVLPG